MIIILVLGLSLLIALAVLIMRRPNVSTSEGAAKIINDLIRMVDQIKTEQRAAQEIQRDLKSEIRSSTDNLKDLVTEHRERRERDQDYFQNILAATKGIESVMRGSKSKGMAGENIIREILKLFPQGTMVYDFKVGSKVVEFGLKLPDGRILPVDSKMVAVDELSMLHQSNDEDAKLKIIRKIEIEVLRKAREVSTYISPPVTYESAIMAVPDSLHYILKESIIRAHRDYHVIIVPYSMTIPYILSFLDLQRKHSARIDEERVKIFLENLGLSLSKMDDILDNKVAKGNVMIKNAYDEYQQIVSKIRGEALSLTNYESKKLESKTDK